MRLKPLNDIFKDKKNLCIARLCGMWVVGEGYYVNEAVYSRYTVFWFSGSFRNHKYKTFKVFSV